MAPQWRSRWFEMIRMRASAGADSERDRRCVSCDQYSILMRQNQGWQEPGLLSDEREPSFEARAQLRTIAAREGDTVLARPAFPLDLQQAQDAAPARALHAARAQAYDFARRCAFRGPGVHRIRHPRAP